MRSRSKSRNSGLKPKGPGRVAPLLVDLKARCEEHWREDAQWRQSISMELAQMTEALTNLRIRSAVQTAIISGFVFGIGQLITYVVSH